MYNSKVLKNNSVTIGGQIYIDSNVVIEQTPSYNIDTSESDTNADLSEEQAESIANIMIAQAKNEADGIVEKAQAQANALRDQLLQENEYLKNKTLEESKQKGYDIGYEEGKKYFLESIDYLNNKSSELVKKYEMLLKSTENEVLEMVTTIVKKVVSEKVIIDKENIRHLISEALTYCNEKNSSIIKVSVDDFKYIKDKHPEIIESINGYLDAQIKPDLSLNNGSCVVNSSNGIVDLSVETRLNKIIEDINSIKN